MNLDPICSGRRHRGLVAIVLACGVATAVAAAPQPVAMVTDLEGGNSVTGMGDTTELLLLAELVPGGRVDLGAGSRLVIVYFASGNEYVFEGPASIRINAQAPEVLSGAGPEERQVLLAAAGEEIIIRPAGMAQASLVMRGADLDSKLRLDNLIDTKTLDSRPVFRWRPLPGVETYHFLLTDEGGATVVETDVAATEFRLPEEVMLDPSAIYTWELEARTPDGAAHDNWGDFSVATDDERALVERMRPPGNAPFSRRVLFAVMLGQMELRDAALEQWRALLAERGDDPQLRKLVGE